MRVSEGKNISNGARDLSCGILANNVPVFCTFPKKLPEDNLKAMN